MAFQQTNLLPPEVAQRTAVQPPIPSPAPQPAAPAPAAPAAATRALGGLDAGTGMSPEQMEAIHGAYTSGWAGEKRIDPRVADRQAAAKELAGNFQIVPADFQGPRLPNQITKEEFEKVVGTYSDIRMGNANLKLDSAGMTPEQAAAFQQATMTDIASMLQTSGGRDLVSQLAAGVGPDGKPRTTSIQGLADPLGAFAEETDPTKRADRENGVGTNMQVGYAPGQDVMTPVAPGKNPWAAPIRSDVVLFHELTHALHSIKGQSAVGPVPAADLAPGENTANHYLKEEYATVGIGSQAGPITENAYRAERRLLAGQPGARPGDELATMQARNRYGLLS